MHNIGMCVKFCFKAIIKRNENWKYREACFKTLQKDAGKFMNTNDICDNLHIKRITIWNEIKEKQNYATDWKIQFQDQSISKNIYLVDNGKTKQSEIIELQNVWQIYN